MRVQNQPAYVLRRYPYSETSLLVDVLSREHGRLMLIAKGARRHNSRMRGTLQAFQPILISWSGKREVPVVTGAETAWQAITLRGQTLFCGFYLNELLLRLLHRHDPHEQLFDAYAQALVDLHAAQDVDRTLRLFEKRLLRDIGYALVLAHEAGGHAPIEAGGRYRYVAEYGPTRVEHAQGSDRDVFSGATLLAFDGETGFDADVRTEAKRLTRLQFDRLLNGRPLNSRILMRQVRTSLNSRSR